MLGFVAHPSLFICRLGCRVA